MHDFSTARLSRSDLGGSVGNWLWGRSGCQRQAGAFMMQEFDFVITF
jgi:hypothetical protein